MRRIYPIVVVLLIVLAVGAGAQVNLIANVAQIPNLADSPDKGVFIDMVKAIDEAYKGGTIKIEVYPFARSYQNMLQGTADFHIPSFVNPVIPKSSLPYDFVPEPMGKVTLVIYSNMEKILTKADIDAALAKGGKFPYVIEVGGGTELNFPFPTVGSNSDEQSLRKVNAGRIDAYIWPPEGDMVVKQHKLSNIHREIFSDFDDVILVAKTARGQEVSRILDTVLKELKRQGKLKQYHDQVHVKWTDWQPYKMGW